MSELTKEIKQIFNDPNFKRTRLTVISDAAPQRNGVGAYYHDLGQYLEIALEDFQVIAPQIINGKWTGGIAVRMPGDPTQKFMLPNPFKIWRQLKKQNPDVVIIATPGVYGVIGAVFARMLGATVLIGFHTWFEKLADLYWGDRKLVGRINLGYFKISNGILFKYGHRVFANSEHMVEIARKQSNMECDLVGTPLAFDFADQPVTGPSRKLKRLLFAGRLAAEKNLPSVVVAARQHPDIEFSIIGDGIERPEMEAAAAELDNFNYLGWKSREELMQEIDLHDAVILPSIVESFGTIAIEAMARQRFTIVSSQCGITQWPELCKGLSIIPEGRDLSSHLSILKNLNANDIEQQSLTGYHKALELNHWSLDLWQKLLIRVSK